MEPLNTPCTLQLRSNYSFRYTDALEIVIETLRILKLNPIVFILIGGLLICPVSVIHLSNLLVDQSVVSQVSIQLLLVAKSSGIPLNSFVKQSCHKFSEIAISSIVYFPLYITLLLFSKVAVVYSIECAYSRKQFDFSKFYVILRTIWRRIVSTYLLISLVIVVWVTLIMMLLICVSRLLYMVGFSPTLIFYTTIVIGLGFAVILVHVFIICDLSMVISMLEDVSGPLALLRSSELIKGQTLVGLMMFIGSTILMGMVRGLFEHRMKSLSDGDKLLRLWERPVLVLVYSFVLLIDFMTSTVFYFSCKSNSLKASSVGFKPVSEKVCDSHVSLDDK